MKPFLVTLDALARQSWLKMDGEAPQGSPISQYGRPGVKSVKASARGLSAFWLSYDPQALSSSMPVWTIASTLPSSPSQALDASQPRRSHFVEIARSDPQKQTPLKCVAA